MIPDLYCYKKRLPMSKSWMKIAASAAALVCVAAAQMPQIETSAKELRPAVTVPFFALDGHGKPTSAITQIDVSVLDNKTQPQWIVAVQAARAFPLRLGVLIDTSNSERTSGMYWSGLQATWEFMRQELKAPEDRIFIVTFGATPDGTGLMNRDELLKFKPDLVPGGGTALFDAIYFACSERLQTDLTQPARRVLVVLSDGEDNLSYVNRDEAIAAAQKAGAVIFVINTRENFPGFVDNSRLQQFADKTGGSAFVHLHRTDLPKAFATISEQIESMYALTFVPSGFGKPGRYHSLELKVTSDKKVKLRAPKGYYAPAGAQFTRP